MSKLIGVLFHPELEGARTLSHDLCALLEQTGHRTWSASAWHEEGAKELLAASEAIVSVGGDGTLMRAVRALIPMPVPVLGIRYGKLGFIAEIPHEEALRKVPSLVNGGGHVEARTLLQANLTTTKIDRALVQVHHPLLNGDPEFHALNDVVLSRRMGGRPIDVLVFINNEPFTTYRADAVIIATATGSTGYALSAGGPILHPTSQSFVFTAVAPHATLTNAVVIEPSATVRLKVSSEQGAILSVDGQVDLPIGQEETVTIQKSPYAARFLRSSPDAYFYSHLITRLRFGEDAGA